MAPLRYFSRLLPDKNRRTLPASVTSETVIRLSRAARLGGSVDRSTSSARAGWRVEWRLTFALGDGWLCGDGAAARLRTWYGRRLAIAYRLECGVERAPGLTALDCYGKLADPEALGYTSMRAITVLKCSSH